MDVRLPDGTIISNVPESTTKAQLREKLARNGYDVSGLGDKPTVGSMLKAEAMTSLPGGFVRGLKDIVDTGAQGAAWLADKVTGGNQAQQVRAMNEAGKADFAAAQELAGAGGSDVARVLGQATATAPLGGLIAKPVGAVVGRVAPSVAPAVTQALRTGGMSTGAAPATMLGRAGDLALRSAAGATVGYGADRLAGGDGDMGAAIGGGLPVAGAVARLGGKVGKTLLGGTTGVGGKAIDEAVNVGRQGGAAGQSFVQSMRGQTSMDDVLAMAKSNVEDMRQQAQAAYRQGMAGVKADKTVLDMTGIQQSLDNAQSMLSFKGVARNPQAGKALSEVADEIAAWRQLDPAEFHTPEGLDALKQRVGALMESIPFEQRSARKAVGDVYASIKKEISKQAPEYSKTMKGYSEAAELVQEIEKALSLGQKSSVDTAMRKLQSLMRNNVNTSYGYRDQLAESMIAQGGRDIMPSLAGQAMSDWLPRGLQRAAAGTGGAGLAFTGNPLAAAALGAVSSPRLVGEAAYLTGRATSNAPAMNALQQLLYRAAPVAGAQ